MNISPLNLQDYTYTLPDEKIAKHPLQNRADSKLLHYDQGKISHRQFSEVADLIPADALLVFNDTRVIPARLILHKDSGARIEIFLLEPLAPTRLYEQAMASKTSCKWHCMIGNAKKWKVNTSLTTALIPDGQFLATRLENDEILFEWTGDRSFSEVLLQIGQIPLPPYLNREANEADTPRYQTVYAVHEGAVAAPTAGLHFSDAILTNVKKKGIQIQYVTLHVSSGTFQPIKAATVEAHNMHREQILISLENLAALQTNSHVVAVGTTSMRTLESLYWYGVKLAHDPEAEFFIEKLYPYGDQPTISLHESLAHIQNYMTRKGIDRLVGYTEIFIFPGYSFRICRGLVTNFHLPGSTLILLVAAFVGEDWRKIYDEALAHNYRFLSYGDSSLLVPKN